MKLKPQPRWMRELRPGDVIRAASGIERVVRSVSFWKKDRSWRDPGRLHFVEVVIARCSWTHRPTTLLDQSALTQFGYRPTRVKVGMR